MPFNMAIMVVRPGPCKEAVDSVALMADGSVTLLVLALNRRLTGPLFPLTGSCALSANRGTNLQRFWLFWDEGMVCTALMKANAVGW